MTREETKSCIGTIKMLQRLAYNIHGVMDVIDADNCKKIIKALEQEPCDKCVYSTSEGCQYDDITETIPPFDDCVRRQEVLDVLKDKWGMFADANDAMQESINAIKAVKSVTPLPQPFDLEGLKSDLKTLNCGFPYGLDYLLDCLNRRLGITIIEADKAEGSDKE